MPVTAGIAIAGTVASDVASNAASQKAQSTLANAASASQVNIPNLENQSLGIGSQNAAASYALQQQYAPWVTPLQNTANTALTGSVANNPGLNIAQGQLTSQLGQGLNTSVDNAAIAAAGQQLALGGQLGQDQTNAATRSALAQAGGATQGGLGLGRDVTAQDLGLTSLQLQQQRIGTALGAGQQQVALGQAQQGANLNTIGALSGLQQNQYGRAAGAAQIGNNIQAPQAGLNPGSVASIATGNANNLSGYYTNLANIQGQTGQNFANSLGQLGTMGAMAYGGSFTNPYQQTAYNAANGIGAGGGQMTYAQYLANNPTSSAVIGK